MKIKPYADCVFAERSHETETHAKQHASIFVFMWYF